MINHFFSSHSKSYLGHIYRRYLMLLLFGYCLVATSKLEFRYTNFRIYIYIFIYLLVPGPLKNFGRRGAAHNTKDEGTQNVSEGKSSKRGATVHGAHEVSLMLHFQRSITALCSLTVFPLAFVLFHCMQKQVWVQKSSAGS